VVTDHAFFIDDDVGAFCQTSPFVPNTEGLHHFAISIAQQRINDLGEIRKGFLRKRCVGTDADDFGVLGLEKRIMVRTGRL
jgi:hypothetical protein